VLSNIPEPLSEEKAVEPTASKEKWNRDSEYNQSDSDSEVDEVLEVEDGMERFMNIASNLSASDVYGLSDMLDY